jgi:hypothetical protein
VVNCLNVYGSQAAGCKSGGQEGVGRREKTGSGADNPNESRDLQIDITARLVLVHLGPWIGAALIAGGRATPPPGPLGRNRFSRGGHPIETSKRHSSGNGSVHRLSELPLSAPESSHGRSIKLTGQWTKKKTHFWLALVGTGRLVLQTAIWMQGM